MRVRLLCAALVLLTLLDATGCCGRRFRCRRMPCCEPCCAPCELGTPCAAPAPCGCEGTTFYPPGPDGPPLGGDAVFEGEPPAPMPRYPMPHP